MNFAICQSLGDTIQIYDYIVACNWMENENFMLFDNDVTQTESKIDILPMIA